MTMSMVVVSFGIVGIEEVGCRGNEVSFNSPCPSDKMIDHGSCVGHVERVIVELVIVELYGAFLYGEDEFEGIVSMSIDDSVKEPWGNVVPPV